MCGIAGYINTDKEVPADGAILQAMCDTMTHRGPDDQGIYIDGSVGIGMRRLSVIDLATGHQPISNETKRIWVVLNGEIYNYRELAVWLKKRGHTLATTSDTEVIVHLYEEMGDDCVHKLRGMFAFALWDQERARLFIARDRLGVKPLYYWWNSGQLVFGSELKVVLAHPEVSRKLNPQGLLYYFRYGYIPDPLTIFSGISKLPPGHILTLAGTSLNAKRYWDGALPQDEHRAALSEAEATERLQDCLRESVRLRLVSDVPIGAFLSGGVDSSLIVALMAQEMTRPVTTFSIGFEEAKYNELPYARSVANHLSTDHHEFIVGPQECGLIQKIVSHFDEPFGDPSAIPTYYLSQLAAQHVTVALSGDGGDELFAGYDRYRVDVERNQFQEWPFVARKACSLTSDILPEGFWGKQFLHNISSQARERYLENISYVGPEKLERLFTQGFYDQCIGDRHAGSIMEACFEKVSGRPWLAQLQYVDSMTYLPADVMTKVDRMSMAYSLEAREPLLDHVLVEYVTQLPIQMKLKDGVSKYLLKKIAERYLPRENVYRKKQGFGVPLEYWFKDELRDYIHDVLFDGRMKARGIISSTEAGLLVRRYEKGRKDLVNTIWMLVIFETWCRLYLDGDPPKANLGALKNASKQSRVLLAH